MPPKEEAGRGRGRGRRRRRGSRRESSSQRGRGRGRKESAMSRNQQSLMRMASKLSVVEDVKIERKQTLGTCAKVAIGIVVSVVVLAGIGTGVYFGVVSPSEPVTTTTVAPTPFTDTTSTTTTTTASTTASPAETIEVDVKWNAVRGDCGKPRQKPNLGRIVGGTEAVKHSWPWQIGLLKYKRYDASTASVKAICGGTLVGPKYIITATHCFLNSRRSQTSTESNSFRVLIGGHDKGRETGGAKMVEIETISHHPKNNLATFTRLRQLPVHDITVIILKEKVDPDKASPMTAFACLPKPKSTPPIGKKCWATGWGKTQGTGSDKKLKQVVQPIVSENNCKKKYGSKGISDEIHLCAGPNKGSEGTCQGDSGGPLVCQYEDGAWVLHGDTSFGPQPCGISPGVWAQVSYHMDWLCCILKGYGPCREIECQM